ncbi:MAG TPA: hypothetical protein VN922_11400 [Bacteroidia bacterium]|nr:hypothetical protein [Bacteroidia bacterium]
MNSEKSVTTVLLKLSVLSSLVVRINYVKGILWVKWKICESVAVIKREKEKKHIDIRQFTPLFAILPDYILAISKLRFDETCRITQAKRQIRIFATL